MSFKTTAELREEARDEVGVGIPCRCYTSPIDGPQMCARCEGEAEAAADAAWEACHEDGVVNAFQPLDLYGGDWQGQEYGDGW